METVLNPDDLTCGICFEVYDNPKILPCVHTFCEKCITGYIEHCESSAAKKGFSCPLCRQFVAIPDPSKNLKEWASQLKSNFFMKNVIQAVGPDPQTALSEAHQTMCGKHMKELDLVCIDCNVMVCATCVAVAHRTCRQVYTLKEAADEKRDTITSLLNGVDAKNSILSKELDKESKQLQEGKGQMLLEINKHYETLKKYLEDEHKKTRSKVLVRYEDAMKVLDIEKKNAEQSRTYLQKLVKEAETVLNDLDATIMAKSATIETLLLQHQTQPESTQGKISGFKLEFLPVDNGKWAKIQLGQVKLTTFQKKVDLPQILSLPRRQSKRVTPSAPPPESPTANLYPNVYPIQRVSNSEGSRQMEGLMEAAGLIPLGQQPQQQQTQLLGSPTSPTFGSLLADPKAVVTFVKKVPVKIKEDKSKPQVRDMTLISGNVIVLTDGGNNAIKSFYTQGPQLQYSRYVTESQPHGVTVLAGNTVVVTVPRQKEMLLLNITPNIFLQKKIATSKRYWAITAVTPEALAVSVCPGSGPASIELVNLEGQLIQVIKNRFMSNPLYMSCLPMGDIIITDPTIQPGIASLRQNGYVVFKYEPRQSAAIIKRPMGVAVDKSGSILVVDQDTGTIMLLDPDGSFVKKLVSLDSGKGVGVAMGERGMLVCAQENQIVEYFVSLRR